MANFFDQFDDAAQPKGGNFFDQFDEPKAGSQEPKRRSVADVARDVGVTAIKGAVALPQAFVGLADIPAGGRVGKALDDAGLRFDDAQKILDEQYSASTQADKRYVHEADGFFDTVGRAVERPATIATAVGESLPSMLGGAGIARGVLKAAPKVAPVLAGAIGEGAIGAGSAAEQIRGESGDGLLTPKQSASAAGSGLVTGILGFAGGKLAQHLGIGDIDTVLAGGAGQASAKGFARQVVESGITEGVFEELPQSAQEQMWQNYATGKPVMEGVENAAAMGMLAGAVMGGAGGGYNAAIGRVSQPDTQPPSPTPTADDVLGTPEPAPAAPTEAEQALYTPKSITALDRAAELENQMNEVHAAAASGDQEAANRWSALRAERDQITASWPKATPGVEASFTTEAGARLDGQYALMEAGDLTTSHDESLRPVPAYPAELQPRERERHASELQIQQIVQRLDPARLGESADAATGAPIVGADGLVESGNARTIALKRVYQANGQKAVDYKQFIKDNAGRFGIAPEAVDAMQRPVLVRVRKTPVNRAEFARQANAATVARMSPSEQARADAAMLDSLDDLQPDESGDFMSGNSRPFVRRFLAKLPTTEQAGLIDQTGNLSQSGYARIRNAVLAKAYGDSPVLLRMVESLEDNTRNLSKALLRVAPQVAKTREAIAEGALHDADITPDLVAAVEELSSLREKGVSVEQALAQAGMFGDKLTPEASEMLAFLGENSRSPRRVADFIQAYLDALAAAGNPAQGSMFGDTAAPGKADLMAAAKRSSDAERTTEDAVGRQSGKDQKAGEGDQWQSEDAQGGQGRAGGDARAGAAADSEWVAFPADTGTLGIPRAEMPQIKGEHRGALIQFLDGRGIAHETVELPADALKPTQAEFSAKKAESFHLARAGVDRSVLASSDGYILDGHHQWVAALASGETEKVIRFDAPIRELLAAAYQFPSVKRSEGATVVELRGKARQDFKDALADLAQIATRHTRAAMLPEDTPDLMPTLVKLFDAGIKEVGYGLKDLIAYVKKALRSDARFKTFWNKISDTTYRKAAQQAIEQESAQRVDDLFAAVEQRKAQGDLFEQKIATKTNPDGIPNTWTLAANGKEWIDERGFVRALKLSERERAVEQALYDQIAEENGYETLMSRYMSEVLKPEDGLLVDPDKVKELSQAFNGDPKLARAVHEPSSDLSKFIFARLVRQYIDRPVVFTAGGGGSGKTEAMPHALKAARIAMDEVGVTFDSTLSSFDSAKKKIDQVVAGDGKAVIVYTNAPIEKAFAFAMGRKRVVPITVLAHAHKGAADAARKLAEHYKGNESVRLIFVNNYGTLDEIHVGSIEDLPDYDYNETVEKLYAMAKEARNEGRIDEERFQALIAGLHGREGSVGGIQEGESKGILEGLPGRPEPHQESEGQGLGTGSRGTGEGGLNEPDRNDGAPGAQGQVAVATRGTGRKRTTQQLREGAGGNDLFADNEPGASDGESVRVRQDRRSNGTLKDNERRAAGGQGDRSGRATGIPAGRDIPAKSGRNYRFGDGDLTYEGGWLKKAAQNVEAVELVKKLEAEGRQATREEQAVLAKFIGWGASEIRNSIFGNKLDKDAAKIAAYERAKKAIEGVGRDLNRYDSDYYTAFETVRESGVRYGDPITAELLAKAKPDMAAKKWLDLRDRLKAAMSEEEWATAERSTQYAHYTSRAVVQSMWKAMDRMGFKGGAIIEPGAGIGVFPGLMPPAMANNSIYTGIEFDNITGAILKQLLPDERIAVESFVDSALPDNFYDVAIGNPPFANTPILSDPKYKKFAFSLHDYFFAKSIDKVKPGGLMVYVTSRYTMDKQGDKARKYLADRADLIGAIRLPQTAFMKNAGTEVVTDVLFLRKRAEGDSVKAGATGVTSYVVDSAGNQVMKSVPWIGVQEIQTSKGPALINEYFASHPEMVLGTHSLAGSMYSKNEYTVLPVKGADIEAQFAAAVENLPADIYLATGAAAEAAKVREIDFNPKAQKEGNYYVSDAGVLMQREGGIGVRADAGKPAKTVELLKDFVNLRDALKQAHYDQLNDGPWEDSLKALQKAYRAFVKKNGNILQNKAFERATKREDDETGQTIEDIVTWRRFDLLNKINDDPDYTLVEALETLNEETGEIRESKFLSERVLAKPPEVRIETPHDALLSVLNDAGKVDLPMIAKRIGVAADDVATALGTAIYESPSAGWQMADEYLSGNVKQKLKEAQQAAKTDKRFERNVEALLAAQPAPVPPSDITVAIGMNWIPADAYAQFLQEKTGIRATVDYNERTGQWSVTAHSGWQTPAATVDWGTPDRNAADILDHALTGRPIRITRTEGYGDAKKTVFDAAATEAANEKLRQMRAAFAEWIWTDGERADSLTRLYNDKFNTIVARKFDGRHLTLPGSSTTIKVFDHVKRGAWRIIQSGNTYLAHAVGSGKTWQMVISAMEQKRLGLINKPMVVVPNHMLQQFAREWLQLYPAARLMVADEKQFHTENRRRFIARVAMSDLDGVIITHSAFKLLDLDPDFKRGMIEEQLDYLRAALDEAGGEEGKKSRDPKVRDIQNRIEKMEQKLEAAMSSAGKDKNVRFDQMGVDMLYVDEAHEYRKLAFTTQRQVKGIDSSGSDRAFDLYMKTRWLEQKKPGRSLVMASGTPVTNTLAELYSVQRFMAPQVLDDRGLQDFDSWSAMFGQENTEIEADASGRYAPVTRFTKFVNVPELTQMFREYADVLTSDHLAEMLGDKRPKVKDGSRKLIITPQTDDYTAYKAELASRLEASRRWKPTKDEPNNPDPIIKIIGDGRLAAIDMRFVDPSLPSDPESKLNQMIDGVIEAYRRTAENEYLGKDGKTEPDKGGVQMVFSDLGFGAGVAAHRGFNARAWFEKRLRDAGIPAKHLAFMSDHKKSTAKLKLFQDANAGRVRILVGSSKNMGTGVNAQQRLVALHHLDTPWYPADLEQREGRIIRQGNKNPIVEIYAYSTKGSYDTVMWQMLASKQRFIDQALSGDSSVRAIDDLTEASQFQVATAMTAGDPRAIQLAGVKADIEKYQRLFRAHEETRMRMRQEYDLAGNWITSANRQLPEAEKLAAKVQDLSGENFKAKADGKTFDKRKEWGEALLSALQDNANHGKDGLIKVGEISGFPVNFHGQIVRDQGGKVKEYRTHLTMQFGDEAHILARDANDDPVGLAMRIGNLVAALARRPAELRQRIADSQAKRAALEGRLDAKFQFAQDLADKLKEADTIEAAMLADSAAVSPAPTSADDEQPKFSRGSGRGMALRDLQAVADRAAHGFKNLPRVNVLESPAALSTKDPVQKALRDFIRQSGALHDVEGATHNGEIYLFASGLAGEARAEHVLATHEVTHYGLRGTAGKDLDAALQHVWLHNARVRKAAVAMKKERGLKSNVDAVEEVLADMPSSELVKLTGWRRVVRAVRNWLNRAGAKALATQLDKWMQSGLDEQQRADLFVAELVTAAREWVRSGKGQAVTGTHLAEMRLEDDWRDQEQWLAREAKLRGYKDIDELAEKAYPVFERLAVLWRKKHPVEHSMLSRAKPVDIRHSRIANDRADAIIHTPSGTPQPVDAVLRGAVKAVGIDRLTRKLYDKAGFFLDRFTPETIKAGFVADHGIPEAVLDKRAVMEGRQRRQLRGVGALLEKLATLTRAESRVAYEWMNNDDPQAAAYFEQQLPAESVAVLKDVRDLIDTLSKEAIRLGQLSQEAYDRNKFAYLHRSYVKHTAELTKGEAAGRKRAIAILGDQYKGRGMTDAVDMAKVKAVAPEWWGRKLKAGQADKRLRGERFIRLERRAATGDGTSALPGFGEKGRGRLLEVAYWPAGEPIPTRYATWGQAGTWEARDTKGAKLVLWRDFTKQEREAMGEIDEARYAIAKTLHAMIHDIETGKYLEWLAQNHAKKEGEAIDGTVVEASERMRDVFRRGEWVRVPEAVIPGTKVRKYGVLAGRYLPGPIWNDVRQTVGFRNAPLGDTYATVHRFWKMSKTALSPAVHMNNVMANLVMADWHDVTAGHIVKALKLMVSKDAAAREVWGRFGQSGGTVGTFAVNELQREQLRPLLDALEKEVGQAGKAAGQIGAAAAVQHLMHLRFPAAFDAIRNAKGGRVAAKAARLMLDAYEAEDQVFRLAAWLKAKEEGMSDMQAGKVARKSFLDYRINAPWVQMMRGTFLPFVAFTYRAAPMALETIAKKPWKLMKLGLVTGLLNAIGYAMSGGDEDDERKLLPEEKAGRIWGITPKLIRMPWNSDAIKKGVKVGEDPVFLDVRRWVPVGDIFDTGATNAAVPLLPSMVPGGPLALLGEIALNKVQFTGKEITLETDTGIEKAQKFAEHLYKAFAPNIIALPGTYAWTAAMNAGSGKTDAFGREQSLMQAIVSSVGVKVGSYPGEVLRKNAILKAKAQDLEIVRNINDLKREAARKGIDAKEFREKVAKQVEKRKGIQRELRERMAGG